jgi:hypothetical protein
VKSVNREELRAATQAALQEWHAGANEPPPEPGANEEPHAEDLQVATLRPEGR